MAVTRSKMERFLRKLEPPVYAAIMNAIKGAQVRANVEAMMRAIAAGDVDSLVYAAGVRGGMWSGVTEAVRSGYGISGAQRIADDVPASLGATFDINNPRAEAWLRKHSSQLITGTLVPEQRGAIQAILESGMARGAGPRTTALDIVGRVSKETGKRTGGVLGLTRQQAQWVTNAEQDLLDFNERYFDRVLRDKRYDKSVRASFETGKPLPEATRKKAIGSYENRMLKHRADTIARTESLAALNEASDEALRQVVQEGLAPNNAVKRIWRHSFAANEREGHLRMNGIERGIDESFTNPVTGAVLKHPGAGPGSETINCRCYLEHRIDFIKVEKAKAA